MRPPADAARAYYRALDGHDYEALRDLLAPGFVQHRPDRTFEGRAAFVSFVREDRPRTDATHDVVAVYPGEREVAVRGRLVADGETLVEFVDVHEVVDGRIASLRTYTR